MIGICFYSVSREFHLIQTGKGEVLGRENTPHKPKSDTAIHQILNTGCQSVRKFGLAYKCGASKLTKLRTILFLIFFNQS